MESWINMMLVPQFLEPQIITDVRNLINEIVKLKKEKTVLK